MSLNVLVNAELIHFVLVTSQMIFIENVDVWNIFCFCVRVNFALRIRKKFDFVYVNQGDDFIRHGDGF